MHVPVSGHSRRDDAESQRAQVEGGKGKAAEEDEEEVEEMMGNEGRKMNHSKLATSHRARSNARVRRAKTNHSRLAGPVLDINLKLFL